MGEEAGSWPEAQLKARLLKEVAAQAGEALKGLNPEYANSGSSAGVAGEPVLSLGERGLGSGDIQIPSDRNLSSWGILLRRRNHFIEHRLEPTLFLFSDGNRVWKSSG